MSIAELIAELEQERFNEDECSAPGGKALSGAQSIWERGYRTGHNVGVRAAIVKLRRFAAIEEYPDADEWTGPDMVTAVREACR
jgi:hypothetical protein